MDFSSLSGLSLLAAIILGIWAPKDSRQRDYQVLISSVLVLFLVSAWSMRFIFSISDSAWLGVGYGISIIAFAAPIYKIRRRKRG